MSLLLVVVCLLLIQSQPEANQKVPTAFHGKYGTQNIWTPTPKANYQKSVVLIDDLGSQSAGTGTIVECEGNHTFVITNEHILREGNGIAEIIEHSGTRTRMERVWSSANKDLAILHTNRKIETPGLPVFTGDVPLGATIEMVGFGGPGIMDPANDIRHVTGKRVPSVKPTELAIDTISVSGDSGGAMLYGGGLVGVNWGYYGDDLVKITVPGNPELQTEPTTWKGGKPAVSGVDNKELERTLTGLFSRFGCRLGRRNQSADVYATCPPGSYCPPTTVPPPTIIPPPEIIPPCPECNCPPIDEIIDEVIANLPPVVIQPSYVDGSGSLQPFGAPIKGYLGETIPLPPMEIAVQSASDLLQTKTQVPIGGRGKLRLGELNR